MDEIWKDIEGFEGLYQISNLGRVRRTETEKIIKSHFSRGGYLFMRLYKGRKYHNMLIHRMVAKAFIENPYCLPQVNHLDENKANNKAENLEWCSISHNINYGTRNEKISQKLGKSVLQTDLYGNVLNSFHSLHEAQRKTGVDYRNIHKCCKHKIKSVGGYKWRYADERL